MTDERTNEVHSEEEIADAMHKAVRARALEQARQEQERPKPTLRDRLPVIALTAAAVLIVAMLINFVVNGMMRIMDIWYPGSISGRAPAAEQPMPGNGNGIDQPYMIGVVPEPDASSSSTSSSFMTK